MKRAKRVERSEKHMLSFKMTTYFPYKVNLSEGQKKEAWKSIQSKLRTDPEIEWQPNKWK